jgi:type 1 glutamine amidotransferase
MYPARPPGTSGEARRGACTGPRAVAEWARQQLARVSPDPPEGATVMSRRKCFLLLALIAATAVGWAGDAAGAEKIKVLLMGGRGHDWKGFHAVMAEVLKKTGDFELTLSDQLDDLKAENIKKYDVVLFYGSGGNFTDAAQEQGLEEFVRGGGGLAGVHATDAFKKSDVYWRLLGGRFAGHGGGTFAMRIDDKKHPITAPMEDFEISDETYRNDYHPDFKLHSLAHMDRGQVQDFGKGRVFNTTLGHGKAAFDNPALQRLVVRGLYWAAGREPKDP